jgi:Glucose-6-phosphate dehydrogenase, NAD binding domain
MPTPAAPTDDQLTIVILGASGDLTRRLLFPAIHRLLSLGRLPAATKIVGYAIETWSDASSASRGILGFFRGGSSPDPTSTTTSSATPSTLTTAPPPARGSVPTTADGRTNDIGVYPQADISCPA